MWELKSEKLIFTWLFGNKDIKYMLLVKLSTVINNTWLIAFDESLSGKWIILVSFYWFIIVDGSVEYSIVLSLS